MIVSEAPQNLIGDNAYDSDKLDTELHRYGQLKRWRSLVAVWSGALHRAQSSEAELAVSIVPRSLTINIAAGPASTKPSNCWFRELGL